MPQDGFHDVSRGPTTELPLEAPKKPKSFQTLGNQCLRLSRFFTPDGPPRPQMAPRWPKRAPRAPPRIQRACPKRRPGARRPQEALTCAQEASKRPPRDPQEASRSSPRHPRSSKRRLGPPWETPKTLQEASTGALPLCCPLPCSRQFFWASFLNGLVGLLFLIASAPETPDAIRKL
eukprot:836175-Pyramimonas_sp.AAC.1